MMLFITCRRGCEERGRGGEVCQLVVQVEMHENEMSNLAFVSEGRLCRAESSGILLRVTQGAELSQGILATVRRRHLLTGFYPTTKECTLATSGQNLQCP
jgi:hypothetical protein